jgi:hypothetical protein
MDGDAKIGQCRKGDLDTLLVSFNDCSCKNISKPARFNRLHLGGTGSLAAFLKGVHLDGAGFCKENGDRVTLIGLEFVFCSNTGKIQGTKSHSRH